MKVIITKVDNGFLVIDDDEEINVFEYDNESEMTKTEKFRDVLYHINELIGPESSRYSKQRIQIDIVPGDKY